MKAIDDERDPSAEYDEVHNQMKRAVAHMSLFGMSCKEDRPRKFETEIWHDAAEEIGEKLLTSHVKTPARLRHTFHVFRCPTSFGMLRVS